MNAPVDHSLQYTESDMTSGISTPSTLPDDYHLPTVVQYGQERASTEILKHWKYQNLGNGPMAASSRLPQKREAPPSQDRFWCNICGRDFAQKQGVNRHQRDAHEVSPCLHCCGFEWHRRHQLKEHLEEQHPDIHLPAALAEVTRRRRRDTMIKNRLHGQQASPPAIEYNQWSWGEHLPKPLTPPLPPVLEATHTSSPEPTMPTITNVTRRHERVHESALFDSTYAHLGFFSTEERAPLAAPNAMDVSFLG